MHTLCWNNDKWDIKDKVCKSNDSLILCEQTVSWFCLHVAPNLHHSCRFDTKKRETLKKEKKKREKKWASKLQVHVNPSSWLFISSPDATLYPCTLRQPCAGTTLPMNVKSWVQKGGVDVQKIWQHRHLSRTVKRPKVIRVIYLGFWLFFSTFLGQSPLLPVVIFEVVPLSASELDSLRLSAATKPPPYWKLKARQKKRKKKVGLDATACFDDHACYNCNGN